MRFNQNKQGGERQNLPYLRCEFLFPQNKRAGCSEEVYIPELKSGQSLNGKWWQSQDPKAAVFWACLSTLETSAFFINIHNQ